MSLTQTLKNGLKAALYHSGLASILARRTSREVLTIVMFHRVLPATDVRSQSADPVYSMDLGVFDAFLAFLSENYTPVSLGEVEDALAGQGRLPPHAALVTFDDGWEDTARYAAPALMARGIPSAVFITSNVLACEHTLWRDVGAIIARLDPSFDSRLDGLSADHRGNVLSSAIDRLADKIRPLMMQPADLSAIGIKDMAIGAHGASHTPLTDSSVPEEELRGSKAALEAQTGKTIASFAYPHGRYNPEVLQKTFAAGYRAIFTSDPILNTLHAGRPLTPVLGRVALSQADITDERGAFSPVRTLFFLAFRKAGALDRNLGSSKGY